LGIDRLEQFFEEARREQDAHRGEESWSVEMDLEAPYGRFHATNDVVIHLDSCTTYLKILADGVAKTIPSLFGAPPFSKARDSINKLWNEALQHPATPLGRLFVATPRSWLDILSKEQKNPLAGIRDARVHHGAWNSPNGHAAGDGPFRVVIEQASTGMQRAGDRRGESITDAKLHSRDMVADLAAATSGFFSFLDHVIRETAAQNAALNPLRGSYSKLGYALSFGPSAFLTSVLPTV
jgi:hypothetical protein